MMGININDKSQNFTDQILSGSKTVETRTGPSLRPYIGKRIGIVRTGKGLATLVGYADIVGEIEYKTGKEFTCDFSRHLVSSSSPFFKSRGFGYVLTNVKPCKPVAVLSRGIVARKL